MQAELLALLQAHARSLPPLAEALSPALSTLLPGQGEFSPGSRFGEYVLEREIGRGGMGVVHLARRDDGIIEQQVAIKLSHVAGPGAAALRDEAQRLERLDHPGIARLLDVGRTADGQIFMVMEYVDGEPLSHWARRQSGIAARLRMFLQVADAIEHAHRSAVLHLDLKPSNVLVHDGRWPKVLDFGIGCFTDAERTAVPWALTPEYAAPEQRRGDAVSVATDVYALGVCLFEMLLGTLPFSPRAREALAPHERSIATPRASTLADALDERALARQLRGDLDAILARACAEDPAGRYASVAALREDIQRWLQRKPVRARGGGALYRGLRFLQRHPFASSCVALLGLLLGLSVLHGLQQWRTLQAEHQRVEQLQRLLVEVVAALPADSAAEAADTAALREPGVDVERWLALLRRDRELPAALRETLIEALQSVRDDPARAARAASRQIDEGS